MLDKIFKRKEKDPVKEKERLTWSILISGTLFLLGIILLLILGSVKK